MNGLGRLGFINGGLVLVGLAFFLACGEGSRPPPAADSRPLGDSGAAPLADGAVADSVTITPLDATGGVTFGDNGFVKCGQTAASQTLTLTNTTAAIVNFTAKLTVGDKFYTVTPDKGGVPVKGSLDLAVAAAPIPAKSDIVSDLYAGILEIKLSNESAPRQIRLHQTAKGSLVTSTLGTGLNLGEVRVGKTGTVQFSMTNAGNEDTTVTFGLGTQVFKIDNNQTGTAVLAAGQTVSKSITLSPTDAIDYADTLTVNFNSSATMCAEPPANTDINGTGTTSVGVSPGTLDFGFTDCGTQKALQKISISTATAMTFNAVLIKSETGVSPYTLVRDDNGTEITASTNVSVGVDQTLIVRVVPKMMAQVSTTSDNAWGDTVRFTTDVPGDNPHNVTLKQTARGTIFTLSPLSKLGLTTPKDSAGTIIDTSPVTVTNIGNQTGSYKFVMPTHFSFEPDNGTLASPPAQVTSVNLLLRVEAPGNGNQYAGDVKLTAAPGTIMCADLPPPMPVSLNQQAN